MDDPSRPSTALPETVQRLMGEAADKNTAKLNPITFDPGQSRMSRPPHWPAVTWLDPGDYCTARYMVVDFLGQGGIGQVFEVRDMLTDTFEALKAVRIDNARPELLEKVAGEARSLRRVEHSNLLRVHDAGIYEEKKLLYFVMERLVGSTLHQRILRGTGLREAPRRPAVPVLEAVKIGIGLARGLNALHEAGIIHRDVKPENIFYTSAREVKVFDLNIAKFNDSCGIRATERGITMGTVLYMSPEHLHEGKADARSDIYAIGFVLFEMIAGHHAFADGPEHVPSHTDAIAWHTARMPPRLSKMIEGVPIVIDAIIRKCTEKDPALRYPTCVELTLALLALERVLTEAEEAAAKYAARGFGAKGDGASQEPEVVVRTPGTAASPRLETATTEQTTTAVPSVPIAILPAPIFDAPVGGGVKGGARGGDAKGGAARGGVAKGGVEKGGVAKGGVKGGGVKGTVALAAVPQTPRSAPASVAPAAQSAPVPVTSSGPRRVDAASGREVPATLRAGGPSGTEMIPTSANSATPMRGRGGTEIIPFPPQGPATVRPGAPTSEGTGTADLVASDSARERARRRTGTTELVVSGAVGDGVEDGVGAPVTTQPLAPLGERGATRAQTMPFASARGPSSRRRRMPVVHLIPYVLCLVIGVALASLGWAWMMRPSATVAATVATASATASATAAAPAATASAAVTSAAVTGAPSATGVEAPAASAPGASAAVTGAEAPAASAAVTSATGAASVTPPAVPVSSTASVKTARPAPTWSPRAPKAAPTAAPSASATVPDCRRKLPTNPCPKHP